MASVDEKDLAHDANHDVAHDSNHAVAHDAPQDVAHEDAVLDNAGLVDEAEPQNFRNYMKYIIRRTKKYFPSRFFRAEFDSLDENKEEEEIEFPAPVNKVANDQASSSGESVVTVVAGKLGFLATIHRIKYVINQRKLCIICNFPPCPYFASFASERIICT